MRKSTIENNSIGEKLFVCEYDNGLKAFVLPKKGYTKKYATYAAHYGSIDSQFVIPGEKEITRVPDGIAHFLEHKLFAQKDGDVMDKYAALGASSNAYTSFDHTAYLFSCSEEFQKCFALLIDFVQNPYITDESVEKEKGIIGQEIRMYEDNPNWKVFFNFLDALYKNHPVKIDIAGTAESIAVINKEILYKCYNTFYHPSNMIVFVAGDVNQDWIFESIASNQKIKESKSNIKRIFPDEPREINKKIVEQKMEVSAPLFIIGFKEDTAGAGPDYAMHSAGMNILMEMLLGKGSDLYTFLYEKGLITSNFDADYTFESNYSYSTIGGESKNPEEVREIIIKELNKIHSNGLDKESFERVKRMKIGSILKALNSVDKIGHQFVASYMKGIEFFKMSDAYRNIKFDNVENIFKKHFVMDNIAMSVVRPTHP
ncbi:MAG: EF-P 5-aminopentanol modification-associated protein YfmH [Deltaproteobacteria bacterium]